MRDVKPATGPSELSIVVVTRGGKQYLDRCLESLTHAESNAGFEVIIPVDESLDHISTLEARYPAWKFLRTAGICSFAQLRSIGVKTATGRVVAVTEDHCLPDRNWVQAIIDAHATEPVAIGGTVEMSGTVDALNQAMYFHDYLRYMLPFASGETSMLSTANASYKMTALRAIADVWHLEFHAEVVHDALVAAGGRLWLSPDIVVNQHRDLEIEHALRDRYAFGRLSGSIHASRTSSAIRILNALLSPGRPLLMIVQLVPLILRRRRNGWRLLAALPAMVMLSTAWACGECMGYFTRKADPRLEPKPIPEFNP
jgi:glycosyltransferase involved in cell wall biosynthesis